MDHINDKINKAYSILGIMLLISSTASHVQNDNNVETSKVQGSKLRQWIQVTCSTQPKVLILNTTHVDTTRGANNLGIIKRN